MCSGGRGGGQYHDHAWKNSGGWKYSMLKSVQVRGLVSQGHEIYGRREGRVPRESYRKIQNLLRKK